MAIQWRDDERQKAWLWIGLVFAAFYFGEAVLFWGPRPLVVAPPFTPFVYWGLFGATVVWLVSRAAPPGASGERRLGQVQAAILGFGITSAVIGIPFLIMARTHDVTLGHAVLLLVMFEAGVVLGGQLLNPGWLLAALLWAGGAGAVLLRPAWQDHVLGLVVAGGFVVVGLLRKSPRPQQCEGIVSGSEGASR